MPQPAHYLTLCLILTAACSAGSGSIPDGGNVPIDLAQSTGLTDLTALADLTVPATGRPLWQKATGGSFADFTTAVATDASDSVYFGGDFFGSMDLGGGPLASAGNLDAFVAKLTPEGNHLWSRRFGGSGDDFVSGLATDLTGNLYVVGAFSGTADFAGTKLVAAGQKDIFAAKLSPAGALLWVKRFGSSSDEGAYAAAVDSAGNLLLCGEFMDTIDFGTGPLTAGGIGDGFLLKLDPSGTPLLARRYGGAGYDIVRNLTVDSSGNILLAGRFEQSVDFGGGPLTAQATDGFLLKLTPTATYAWARPFSGSGQDEAYAVTTDSAGNVAVTGSFEQAVDFGTGPLTSAGKTDLFLAKYDPTGRPLFSLRGGGPEGDSGIALAAARDGSLILFGDFRATASFGGPQLTALGATTARELVLAKYTSTGTHVYSYRLGSPQDERAYDLTIAPNGDLILGGLFSGTADFGGPTLTAIDADGFVLRRAP